MQQYKNLVYFKKLTTKDEIVNSSQAIWTKTPSQVKKDEYSSFYKSTCHAIDEPWMTLHNKAEGVIEYTNLLFIPTKKPFFH